MTGIHARDPHKIHTLWQRVGTACFFVPSQFPISSGPLSLILAADSSTCRGSSLILTILWWRLHASSAIWCFLATAFPGCLLSVACSCSGLPLTWAWLLALAAAGLGTMVGFADLVFSQLSGGLLASEFDWPGQGQFPHPPL